MSEVLLRASGLSKVFGHQPQRALELLAQGLSKETIRAQSGLTVGLYDVSLSVQRGETFVVMGLSGSGKSSWCGYSTG